MPFVLAPKPDTVVGRLRACVHIRCREPLMIYSCIGNTTGEQKLQAKARTTITPAAADNPFNPHCTRHSVGLSDF